MFAFRLVSYVHSQPAAFFFILSLFLISITFSILGVYVTDSEMPDLDAMKNWNAYIGKLSEKDFCFKQSSTYNDFLLQTNVTTDTTNEYVQSLTNSSIGTVDVAVNFTIPSNLFPNQSIYGAIHSQVTGKQVGTQIRDSKNGQRVDEKIILNIWINLINYNTTKSCHGTKCPITGCLLISAPLTAVPTRMPHIHKDFSFLNNILNSSILRRPSNCSCSKINASHAVLNLDINTESNCKSILEVVRQRRHARGYGIINIKLAESDRNKASRHMYLAGISTAALGIAFIIGIMFTSGTNPPKKSQE